MPDPRAWIQQHWKKYFSSGRRVSPQALKYMAESLLEESTAERNFIILILGSCIIATLGLLANSTAVIIGAMLIAPLMLPIRGLAFGILEADHDLIRTGIRAVSIGTGLAISISMLLGISVNLSDYGSEVWSRSRPNLLDLGIAIAAGALAGFAKIEAKLSNSLAGTAIAVALMPPLCVVGLWLAQFELREAFGALLLYVTNLMGITLACMVAFLGAGYSPFDRARRPLGATFAITALLVLPLGYTSYQLIRQDRLEYNLQRALLDKTITFQRLRLVSMETDWLQTPPSVTLTVYASSPVTPVQVDLLEQFVQREMGQPFQLVFEVGQLDEVTSTPVRSMGDSAPDEPPTNWQDN
ncbi:MAG: TIGR00341 family protein [Leptolyngbya sp. SIO1D8]|nr:TIGR00341 family protein [Leptolyngbya sp. SIO1D8]